MDDLKNEVIRYAVVDGAKTMLKFTWSRIMTLRKYEENIVELRNQIAILMTYKMSVERDVNLAKIEGKTPKPQVNEWLMKASREEDDVRPLLEMADNMMHQYRQCWTIAKKLNVVKELNSVNFDSVAPKRSSSMKSVVEMAVPPLKGQGAASALKQLLEILNMDDISRRVAVYGMGGIGKTILVMNLNNELCSSSQHSFDIVIWVQGSRSLDLRTIQSQIAKRIHLKVEANDTTISIASGILERLKLMKKILLIIDDVWEKIDLDAVGIPLRDDCCKVKVLLTTRSLVVCNQMAVNIPFRLNLMNEEDAWNLFADIVGHEVHSDGIEPRARKTAASCHGLPLAIKTLGNSMRGVSLIELWENANRTWWCSPALFNNIEQEVFQHLESSYYALPSKDLKQCFRYCSLYPESLSINVSELIHCWVSDGVISERQTMEETFNYGLALIERLKDLCLLDQDSEGTVKMHFIFRELARRLSQSEEQFIFQSQSKPPSCQMPTKSFKRSYQRELIQVDRTKRSRR